MVIGCPYSVAKSPRLAKKRRCASTVRAEAASVPFLAARSMSLPGAAGAIRYSVYDNVATASTLPSPWNYTSIGGAVSNTCSGPANCRAANIHDSGGLDGLQ